MKKCCLCFYYSILTVLFEIFFLLCRICLCREFIDWHAVSSRQTVLTHAQPNWKPSTKWNACFSLIALNIQRFCFCRQLTQTEKDWKLRWRSEKLKWHAYHTRAFCPTINICGSGKCCSVASLTPICILWKKFFCVAFAMGKKSRRNIILIESE